MNRQSTDDRADEALRALLAQTDPEAGSTVEAPAYLLDRVLADAAKAPTPEAVVAHPSWIQRHWQGSLLVAASVATLALATPTVLPGMTGSSGSADSAAGQVTDSAAASRNELSLQDSTAGGAATAGDKSAAEAPGALAPDAAVDGSTGTTTTTPEKTDEALVRSGSVLVGSEDPEAARDKFVATVLAMGGRVTSESVVTEGGGGVQPYGPDVAVSSDMGVSYPYPWYPSGPGIWLTVQVPVDDYDEAMEAARDAGEVVQMQQSTYDVGAQVADVDARIKALEASLVRLTALMDEATDITDVITLEQAISQRQSELDALKAQQRDLANQTAMSQISLTLMSPEDAQNSVDPQPQQTWWESFLEGLSQFWSWFGQALLIISPLLIAMGIIAWVRRRRSRRAASTTSRPSNASVATGSPDPSPAADHTS